MLKIQATIKAPVSAAADLKQKLASLGAGEVSEQIVSYETFVSESRLNYDCVYPEAWEDKVSVVYLTFFFDDSREGREAAFRVEYGLKQIPLNLRYVNV